MIFKAFCASHGFSTPSIEGRTPRPDSQASYREFFIEFKPSHPMKDQCTGANGRKQSCVYQLVMNMKVEEEEFPG